MTGVVLAPELFASEGGIPRILRLYVQTLAGMPGLQDLHVVALNDGPEAAARFCESTRDPRILFHPCSRSKPAFIRRALGALLKADWVLCGHLHLLPVAALARKIRPRLRMTVVAHGIEAWRPPPPAVAGALARCDRVFCVSAYTRREVMRLHPGLSLDNLRVVPNAVDPVFETARQAPLAAPVPGRLLTVSRLSTSEPYKGVRLLLEAMPRILSKEPEATLRIVGDGDDRPALESAAARLPVGCATFLGAVEDIRLKTEYEGCSVFVLPSTREGFGLVFAEAMAHGRPCVGVRAAALPEVVTEATGLLAPPGDTAALAAACVEALRTSWEPRSIRQAATAFSPTAFRSRLLDSW